MATQTTPSITKEAFDNHIVQAAKAAGYENGFGIPGCDLAKPTWTAAYCRQSLDQQMLNNRLPEYLFTMAKMAKEQGLTVPKEFIFYDHSSGENLSRPQIEFLRHELIHKRKVACVIFADLRCLSREPAPQQVFERECEILGVRLLFGDAPSGMDIGSQFARSALTFSNKLTRLATNRNARAGNVGRVLKGWVPSHKAPYGYVYRRDAEITQDGKVHIKRAWWDADELDSDGRPIPGSPADVVVSIFQWLGNERRTAWWVAKRLNELNAKPPASVSWSPSKVSMVIHNHCYTGKHRYNAFMRVPNPQRPLGDITSAVKRTLLRAKPVGESVEFNVPSLVSEELWLKTTETFKKRGRGRGKEGKVIQALLRGRIFCPRCSQPMVIRRKSNSQDLYYHCSRHYRSWSKDICSYRGFVPGAWDEAAWDAVFSLLMQDDWIEKHLGTAQSRSKNLGRLIKIEEQKITQAESKINKIREGFESELYSLEEAKIRIASYRAVVMKAEAEVKKIREKANLYDTAHVDADGVRNELKKLAQQNLNDANFQEKRDLMNKLDFRIYPSEDLKTMGIKCGLKLVNDSADTGIGASQDQCGKVVFDLPTPLVNTTSRLQT